MSYRLIDPDETLDFSVDWTTWLDTGVNVSGAATWAIAPTGPTLSNQTVTSNIATTFVADCTLGVVYILSCKVTTDAGTAQVAERSIALRCEQR